jgi:hypothetical protein
MHGGAGLAAGAAGAAAARPRWSSGTPERGRASGADPGPGAEAPERGRPRSRASALARRPGCSRGHSGPALRRRLPQLLWGFWRRRRRRARGNARRIPIPSLGSLPCATTSQAADAKRPDAGQLRPQAGTVAGTPGTSLTSPFRSALRSVSRTSSLPRPPRGRPPSLAPSLHPYPALPPPCSAPPAVGRALGPPLSPPPPNLAAGWFPYLLPRSPRSFSPF